MPRKNNSSPAEDLMEIVAFFPWWIGVISAAVAYFLLHAYAGGPSVPGSIAPGKLGDFVASTLFRNLAEIGQYLLPCIFLVGAAVSAIRAHKRLALLNKVAEGDGPGVLHEITWQQFELLVGQWFRQQGYTVRERGGSGADGGIDLELTRKNETFFVQCKQWRTTKVGVHVVRELYGVMAAHGATGGFVITSGTFTADALLFAEGRNLQLLDGTYVARMIQAEIPPAPISSNCSNLPAQAIDRTTPHCPVCGVQMVQRVAKRGTTAGQRFWGCSGFPNCKGTLPG